MTIALRAIGADDWRLFRELRLEALREAPYAFETTLAEWQGDRDTEERWKQRLTDVPFNAVAYLDGEPVGIVSGTQPSEDSVTELISMWVAPVARGKGVGEALVDAVVSWAHAQRIAKVSLDVREDNGRAKALYTRCGFIDQGRISEHVGPQERRMVIPIKRINKCPTY